MDAATRCAFSRSKASQSRRGGEFPYSDKEAGVDFSSLPRYPGRTDADPSQRERLVDRDRDRAERADMLLVWLVVGLLALGVLVALFFWLAAAGPFFYPQLA